MGLRVDYTTWQEAIRQIATNWNTSFSGSGRLSRGVDTTDYVITDSSTKGPVLKSPDGHYWLVTVNNAGVLSTSDLGTVKP